MAACDLGILGAAIGAGREYRDRGRAPGERSLSALVSSATLDPKRATREYRDEARAALSELRELARGIHPQILTSAGLHAAVESLAARSPAAVSVDIDPVARFAPNVEAIAYFVVSESLANIAKHAEAGAVDVRARWQDAVLTVEVADDGRGGADPQTGTGLRGLLDRVSAVDGTLVVVSPPGGGTRVVARIPAAAPTYSADRAATRAAP